MPARFEIDKERRLVRSFAWGNLSFADILQHQQMLRADPKFDSSFDQIADFTDVASIEISAEDVRVLAQQVLFSSTSYRAFVAPSALAFGMVRMFKAHHELSVAPSKTMVFTTLADALQWLDSKE